MNLPNTLSPDEIKFFETGELPDSLRPGAPAPAPAPAAESMPPAPSPLDLAGLSNAPTPAPAAEPSPPAPAPAPSAAPAPAADPAMEVLRQSLAEAQRTVGALQAQIQAAKAPAPAAEPPAPDPQTDPLGAMMHALNTVNKQVADLKAQMEAQSQQVAQTDNLVKFQNQVVALRDEFAKTHADFQDAYSHLRNNRVADLRSFGLTDEQINQTVYQEEVLLAQNAIRNARNPAEVIYEMARRQGYAPKTAAPAASPAPAPAQNAQNPDDKLATIRAAQDASRNLPRNPDPGEIDVSNLRKADDSTLNNLVLDDKQWRRLAGGDQYPL